MYKIRERLRSRYYQELGIRRTILLGIKQVRSSKNSLSSELCVEGPFQSKRQMADEGSVPHATTLLFIQKTPLFT